MTVSPDVIVKVAWNAVVVRGPVTSGGLLIVMDPVSVNVRIRPWQFRPL